MATGLLLGTDTSGTPLTLDPKALTTHGFVLGMTGSGKTGLCVVLVEELLRAGVPVIAVDSKGDLGTLLLGTAPDDATSLSRWMPGDAQAGERLARGQVAAGLTPEAAKAFRASYEPRLYTPGSQVGLTLDLVGTLAPPPAGDVDATAEAADGAARGLLGLLGIEADPVASREYLLLVQILTTAWGQGLTPTLVDLVRAVAQPPFQTVGALPLEDFYPQRERQALMVRLNGLLASPRFAAWRMGEPLDPGLLFRGPSGKPRLSIYSVAHLEEEERIFAVAQLLERVQSWMRKQGGGGGALKGVVLVDEIFGYFPPAPANPPTKAPLLGLLKQARAFGVSVVLATQNPIDLDYRGLANIGTWLVGRLQTEQDKNRIRDALVSAASASGVTAAQLDGLIAKLEPRRFLLHSIHRPQPTVLASREAMTLLHGPFSAEELRELAAPMKAAGVGAPPAMAQATSHGSASVAVGAVAGAAVGAGAAIISAPPSSLTAPPPPGPTALAPAVPMGIDPELGPAFEVDKGQGLPFLVLKFGVRYRLGTAVSEETMHELAFPLEGTVGPAEVLEGTPYGVKGMSFQATPPAGMTLAPLPAWVTATKALKVQSAIRERLPSKLETRLYVDEQTRLISGPTETLEAFAARVGQKQGLSRDAQRLGRELEKRKADIAQLEKELTMRKAEKWLQVGGGVLSLFSGRRSTVSSVGRALSSQRMEGGTESRIQDLQIEVQQLEAQLAGSRDIDTRRFTEQVAVPRGTDVQVLRVQLAWIVP